MFGRKDKVDGAEANLKGEGEGELQSKAEKKLLLPVLHREGRL